MGQPRGALDVLETLGAVFDEGVGESPAQSNWTSVGGDVLSMLVVVAKSRVLFVGAWSLDALPRMNPMAFSGRTDETELKVVITLSGTISMMSLTDGSDIVTKIDGKES